MKHPRKIQLSLFFLVFWCLLVPTANGEIVNISAAVFGETTGMTEIRLRSAANTNTKEVVLMYTGSTLKFKFGLNGAGNANCALKIANVIYSNDGNPDTIKCYVDNVKMGQVTTHGQSNWGHLWNEFYSTGPIGTALPFATGAHNLTISVVTDSYGVEIDIVSLQVNGGCSANIYHPQMALSATTTVTNVICTTSPPCICTTSPPSPPCICTTSPPSPPCICTTSPPCVCTTSPPCICATSPPCICATSPPCRAGSPNATNTTSTADKAGHHLTIFEIFSIVYICVSILIFLFVFPFAAIGCSSC